MGIEYDILEEARRLTVVFGVLTSIGLGRESVEAFACSHFETSLQFVSGSVKPVISCIKWEFGILLTQSRVLVGYEETWFRAPLVQITRCWHIQLVVKS